MPDRLADDRLDLERRTDARKITPEQRDIIAALMHEQRGQPGEPCAECKRRVDEFADAVEALPWWPVAYGVWHLLQALELATIKAPSLADYERDGTRVENVIVSQHQGTPKGTGHG